LYSDDKLFRKTRMVVSKWRNEAKRRPEPTVKVPPFPPLKFAYNNS